MDQTEDEKMRSRGTTSIYRPLTKAASAGIQQYPAPVTGGPVPLYLAIWLFLGQLGR